MSNPIRHSGTNECPDTFRKMLPTADADCLDETLTAMPEAGFDAAAVTGKTLAKLGLSAPDGNLTVVSENPTIAPASAAGTPKRRFRAVLIAACAAVLLLATVAVAKIVHDKKARVIEVTELTENLTAERGKAFQPLGQSGKLGDITITAADMLGDSHRMFIEVSTDVSVDAPDGWLAGYMPAEAALSFACTAGAEAFADCAAAPFAKDGKLWYMVSCADNRDAARTINRLPVSLQIRRDADAQDPLTLSWTNDYDVSDRVIAAGKAIEKYQVDMLSLTVCDLTVELSGDTAGYALDYITLASGNRLYEIANTALPLYPATELERTYDDNGNLLAERRHYSLLEGFALEPGGDAVFVPASQIASVTIGGVTIPVAK